MTLFGPEFIQKRIEKMKNNLDIDGLNALLEYNDILTRKKALEALVALAEKGNYSKRTVKQLFVGLKDAETEIRQWSSTALGVIAQQGGGDGSFIDPLNTALENIDEWIRQNAAITLGIMAQNGFVRPSSVEYLNKALKDPDKEVRQCSAWALRELALKGVCNRSSIGPLNQALHDKVETVNQEASKALDVIVAHIEDRNKMEETMRIETERLMAEEKKRVFQSSVKLIVPLHIESGTHGEIVVSLINPTDHVLEDISVDFSNMEEFFEVEGEVYVKNLYAKMELENNIRIKPRFTKGNFPVKIIITGCGSTLEKLYSIKVGGTEVY